MEFYLPFVLMRPALVLFFAGACLPALAQVSPLPPAQAFFGHSPIRQPVLSPDGKTLAVIVGAAGKRDSLGVIDLNSGKVSHTAKFDDVDIGRVKWVNNERLVFSSVDKQSGQGDQYYAPGLYAINADGSKFRQLARRDNRLISAGASLIRGKMLPWHTYMMGQDGAQDSNAIYVESRDVDVTGALRSRSLLRLDTMTGASEPVDRPGPVLRWLLDNKGEPRLAVVPTGPTIDIHYRDAHTNAWRKLARQSAFAGDGRSIKPVAFGAPGTLYVTSTQSSDTSALYAMNMETGKLDAEPLISAPGYDFDGGLVFSNGKLAGFSVTTDATSTMWFDPAFKAVQQEVDRRLPNTANLVRVPSRPQSPWVLVESVSDTQPSVILVFNTETKQFTKLGEEHPQIVPAQMGRQEMVRYKARDGLSIPALLTLPPGGKRKDLPLVVLVHGGPYVRGARWGWDPQVQFLATRGYAVLQPEFRGSTGFGFAHFRAGWKQWGLAMQNDIADGAKWAIAEGMVDPKRICIAGASYGGYAALMGLVNDPDLFQCAINWAGVTDIELLYNGSWGTVSDVSDEWRKYGMPELVGDLVKDAAQLKATSPLQQAARITKPVLLAYGGADKRVPLHHGEKFYKAVKQGNPNVEWVEYPAEGHGWALPETRVDFWTRVEKFLERHIGVSSQNR